MDATFRPASESVSVDKIWFRSIVVCETVNTGEHMNAMMLFIDWIAPRMFS